MLVLRVGIMAAAMLVGVYVFLPRAAPLEPDPRIETFDQMRANFDSRKSQIERTSFESDGDPVRDGLRRPLLEAAKQLANSPCNNGLKRRYLEAASAYVKAFQAASGCTSGRDCNVSGGRFAQARAAFGSPLDKRLSEAMADAEHAAFVTANDFPDNLRGTLPVMRGGFWQARGQSRQCDAYARQ